MTQMMNFIWFGTVQVSCDKGMKLVDDMPISQGLL